MKAKGILLLYHHYMAPAAHTIMEHVGAFRKHSRYQVWELNTELGFPEKLRDLEFEIIVLHYSLFAQRPFYLNDQFSEYLQKCSSSYKIAFFQDEYRYCPERFEFLDTYKVDHVYSLLEPDFHLPVYLGRNSVSRCDHTLTGYVSDEVIAIGGKYGLPESERTIDVGYRARSLPWYFGKGAAEKEYIGRRFKELAAGKGLRLDIAFGEESRLYGRNWWHFLGRCRSVLGVEAGVSVFDIDGSVERERMELAARSTSLGPDELAQKITAHREGLIPYRTISPRHFEAAAFRVCQILFTGSYTGILEPMVHYIPLEKDFSNLDEVLRQFNDAGLRRTIVENAFNDLIRSGSFSYRSFIAAFDRRLEEVGFRPGDGGDYQSVASLLNAGIGRRRFGAALKSLRHRNFPGKSLLRLVSRSIKARIR